MKIHRSISNTPSRQHPEVSILPVSYEEKQLTYPVLKNLPSGQQHINGYSINNKIKLISAGRKYFELLKYLINTARETIHLQVYIFAYDETGKEIANTLINAAKRNVRVHVMTDGYASQSLPASFIQKLKAAGVNFRFFEPVFKSRNFYFGRRMHHKVFVADERYALVGGINIANRYNDSVERQAWLDFALFAEGEIAKDVCSLCWETWEGFLSKTKTSYCERKINFEIPANEKCRLRLRSNDWVRNKNQISRSYLEMFRNAKSYITIVSSYFLPGRIFKKNIAEASKRGVKIKVVLTKTSDVSLAKHGERYMYRWLLKNNVEIFEYKRNILHGKLSFYDDKWITAGSYNVNNISAYASIELNLDVNDERFTKSVKQTIDKIIENDCIKITEEYFNSHNHFFQRIWQRICSDIIRVIFYLFTFYFKQRV